MAEADVKQLVTDLALGLEDTLRVDQQYDEVVEILEQFGWWTQLTLVSLTSETQEYTLPTNVINILAAFYDDQQLSQETRIALQAWSRTWEDEVGTPFAFVQEHVQDRNFQLYQKPTLNSKDFTFAFGAPFGEDYPEYSVAVVATERRATFSPWLWMVAALLICAREFRREGKNRDLAFSASCESVAAVLLEGLA